MSRKKKKKKEVLLTRVHNFWFAESGAEPLALFRIVFGLYLLLFLIVSFPNWERFYGPDGVYPFWLFRFSTDVGWTVLFLNRSLSFVWGIYIVLALASISFLFGRFSRIASIVLFIGFHSLIGRNFFLLTFADRLTEMFLFFCCFAPVGESLSVDCAKRGSPQVGAEVSIWALRLMQVSFLGIYFFSGLLKLKYWVGGDAVYYMSLSRDWFRFPDVYFFHTMAFSRIFSYVTVALELSFPFLVWKYLFRVVLLPVMIMFHVLGVFLFSSALLYLNLLMIIGLLLFVDSSWVQAIVEWRNSHGGLNGKKVVRHNVET